MFSVTIQLGAERWQILKQTLFSGTSANFHVNRVTVERTATDGGLTLRLETAKNSSIPVAKATLTILNRTKSVRIIVVMQEVWFHRQTFGFVDGFISSLNQFIYEVV